MFLSFRTHSRFMATVAALLLGLCIPGAGALASHARATTRTWQVVAPQRPSVLFHRNAGIAVDRQGTVYVADPSEGRVVKLSPRGVVIARLGTDTPGPLHWSPQGIAADSAGNLYVLANGVTRVTSSGGFLTRWDASGAQAIAVGGAGNVFVLSTEQPVGQNTRSGRIDKFSSQGTLLGTWHTPGSLADSVHTVEANGIAVDPRGDVYVTIATADNSGRQGPMLTSALYKLSPAGTLLSTVRSNRMSLGPIQAADGAGNMYLSLTDYGETGVEKLSSSGGVVGRWGSSGTGQYGNELHLALDGRGRLYVADSGSVWSMPTYSSTGIVHILTTSGRRVAQWGRLIRVPSLPMGLGLAMGPGGTIYTTASDQHVFLSVSPGGRTFRALGKLSNNAPVIYFSPIAIALDGHGNVYVTDAIARTVDRFTPDGRLTGQWRVAGRNQGPVNGLALDRAGNMYVLVVGQVVKLSPSGRILARFGSIGSGPGQFSAPFNLTVDGQGNIYVADTHNNRIQKLSPSGQPLASWGAPGEIDSPLDVVVGASGHVFALDPTHSDVVEFAPGGSRLATWGVPGTLPGQLSGPTSLAMGPGGVLYVLDYGNNRIQKLVIGR